MGAVRCRPRTPRARAARQPCSSRPRTCLLSCRPPSPRGMPPPSMRPSRPSPVRTHSRAVAATSGRIARTGRTYRNPRFRLGLRVHSAWWVWLTARARRRLLRGRSAGGHSAADRADGKRFQSSGVSVAEWRETAWRLRAACAEGSRGTPAHTHPSTWLSKVYG